MRERGALAFGEYPQGAGERSNRATDVQQEPTDRKDFLSYIMSQGLIDADVSIPLLSECTAARGFYPVWPELLFEAVVRAGDIGSTVEAIVGVHRSHGVKHRHCRHLLVGP